MRRQARITVALVVAIAILGACVQTGRNRDREGVPERTRAVVVGAFNFSESRVLAEIFAQTIRAAGFDAELLGEVGSREIMEPALEQGQIDLVAEYLGTALTFLDPEAAGSIRGARPAYEELKKEFGIRGIEVLVPSPGENRNELVVTRSTQERYELRTISDLRRVAGQLTLGGPPECPSRPLCLQGLERLYNLRFDRFLPLDSGGPATVAALAAYDIDVAVLFTTNPAIDLHDFTVLRDDRGLQPAENVVPVIRRELVEEYGSALIGPLDAVTAKLTNATLRRLNARAEIDHVPADQVAADWLRDQGVL